MSPHDQFLQMACLHYDGQDDPARRQAARRILAENPQLTRESPHAAAAAGDLEALRYVTDVTTPYEGWTPILYACYSRVGPTKDAVRVLLEKGADPNSSFFLGESRFTALTGAFGEGEQGPVRQPPHPECEGLARLLLESGADPNDGQALYNTLLEGSDACLQLLLLYGLNAEHRCSWDPEMGMLDYLLQHAIRLGQVKRATLLVEHGAYLDDAVERAMLAGQPDLARWLQERGFLPADLPSSELLIAAAMAGQMPDQGRLNQALAEAATRGQTTAVHILAALGAELDGSDPTALHLAVWHGHEETVKLLVSLGADPQKADASHGSSPLEWALYRGDREKIIGLLL
ncbi:MAG: hypothetical protein AMXMBFR33_46900 [Candidatus Xenobia bacterium]